MKPRFLENPAHGRLAEWLGLGAALAWLLLAWSAAIAVDVFNAFGLQAWLDEHYSGFPLLWYRLFSEASPTEWLQWALLATGCGFAVAAWLRARRQDDAALQTGWFVLAAGLALMLIEDSLNLRHLFLIEHVRPILDALGLEVQHDRLIWELLVYTTLAAVMATAAWLLITRLVHRRLSLAVLVLAYASYGTVGFASAGRRIFEWQERLGEIILARFDLLSIPTWQTADENLALAREQVENFRFELSYLLVDHWLEESVELLAAGLLLTAVILLFRDARVGVPGKGPMKSAGEG